jgi:type II secretory pathway component PulK
MTSGRSTKFLKMNGSAEEPATGCGLRTGFVGSSADCLPGVQRSAEGRQCVTARSHQLAPFSGPYGGLGRQYAGDLGSRASTEPSGSAAGSSLGTAMSWKLSNRPAAEPLGSVLARMPRSCSKFPSRVSPARNAQPRRHGTIYILALGVTVVLSGMVLVFARNMRTESLASANRLSYAKADAIEQGAEQWVLAQVGTYQSDALTITQVPAEAIQVGDGYFWLLHPNPVTDQIYMAGIVDESSKLNINVATSAELTNLPGMTPVASDSLLDWVDADSTPRANGAESDFYEQLAEPYDAKNAPFETVEELSLVNGWDKGLLFGYDVNRDGVVDQNELNAAGTETALEDANGNSRGMFNWLTCYSHEPNTASDGSTRVNVNAASTNGLSKLLTKKLSSSRATQIITRIRAVVASHPGGNAFSSIGSFYRASGMTITEFGQVSDYITTTSAKTLTGLIDVNTAPLEVLECLPGLTESDAETLIGSQSTSNDGQGISWVFNAIAPTKAVAISNLITSRSFVYSADIVAVSGDGRAFKRVRIVVDATTLPAKVIYRRDLTSYGWPLPPQIQQSMRSGKGVVTGMFATPGNTQVNGLSQ